MIRWFLSLLPVRHRWEYRNPYNRTCRVCGQNEVQHSWGWGDGWWEAFHQGDELKHRRAAPAQGQDLAGKVPGQGAL